MAGFVKSHGLGNDYIVLNGMELDFPLTGPAIQLICDRHRGVGSDGILLLTPSEQADFGVRIYNPDGSEAEKSGNGLRILAQYLFRHRHTSEHQFTVETAGGLVTCRILDDGAAVSVDMGRASFRSGDIPVTGPDREVINEEAAVAGRPVRLTAVNLGNPHCVVLSDDVAAVDLQTLGPALETHSLFPRRTNVQLAQVVDRDTIAIRIWERGAGHTLASGSSSCAATAACRRLGLVNDRVRVEMEGGTLDVQVDDDFNLVLTGPVEEVCKGEFSDDLMARLG